MTTTTRPGLGLAHAAGTIDEPVGTPAVPVRPSVLTPAHWGPRPRRSPSPAALLLAPWGCPLRPPRSQPPKLPLFPPKQPRLPLQPMQWGDRWHREAPAAVGQLRAEPGAALGEASGRMEFPASLEKGSQMSFYGLGTRFSPSCEGREH